MEDNVTMNNHACWFCENWDHNVIVNSIIKECSHFPLRLECCCRIYVPVLSEMNLDKWERLGRLIYACFILTAGHLISQNCLVLFTRWLDFDHWSAQQSRCLAHVCNHGDGDEETFICLSGKPEIRTQRVIFIGHVSCCLTITIIDKSGSTERARASMCVLPDSGEGGSCSPAQPLQPI